MEAAKPRHPSIERILSEYRQSKKSFRLTDKQQEYIQILHNNIYSDNIFTTMTDLLNKPIECWQCLKSDDVRILIAKLKNRQKASQNHQELIKRLYSIERINMDLKLDPPLESYEDLNYYHIKRLLATPAKFNFRSSDHPLHGDIDYEYGYQDSDLCKDGKMYYLKFYDLMMLDYDGITYEQLLEILEPYADLMYFYIYKTFNGFHVFVMSGLYPHNTNKSSSLMSELKCDPYYTIFCYRNGYKIRLSPKMGRGEEFIAEYITDYGSDDMLDPECSRLIEFHNFYV